MIWITRSLDLHSDNIITTTTTTTTCVRTGDRLSIPSPNPNLKP